MKHIEKIKHDHKATQQQVMNLLGWSIEQYTAYVERMGLLYLTVEFDLEDYYVRELPKHTEYWGWWKSQWQRRDEEFIGMCDLLFPHEREGYYHSLHDPALFMYRPHQAIMESTYATMIDNLIKNEKSR